MDSDSAERLNLGLLVRVRGRKRDTRGEGTLAFMGSGCDKSRSAVRIISKRVPSFDQRFLRSRIGRPSVNFRRCGERLGQLERIQELDRIKLCLLGVFN